MPNSTLVKIKNVDVRGALLNECFEYSTDKFGVVTRSMHRWQPDLRCTIHVIELLVDGGKNTYWRPITGEDSYTGINDTRFGVWEQSAATGNGAAFFITTIE